MMSDVRQIASHQIVHCYQLMPLGYQAIDHVAANKTGPAGDKNAHSLFLLVETRGQGDKGTRRRGERIPARLVPLSPLLLVSPSPRLHLPIPRYLNPASSTACGSNKLRPSMIAFAFITWPI